MERVLFYFFETHNITQKCLKSYTINFVQYVSKKWPLFTRSYLGMGTNIPARIVVYTDHNNIYLMGNYSLNYILIGDLH